MNSPLSRVENELSDSDVIENALRDSSPQVKVEEVKITFLEDAFTLPEDAFNNEDALSIVEEAGACCEDGSSLQLEPIDDESHGMMDGVWQLVWPPNDNPSVYIATRVYNMSDESSSGLCTVSIVPISREETMQVGKLQSPSWSLSQAFSSWRSQPSVVSESTVLSQTSQDGTRAEMDIFVSPCRTIRPHIDERHLQALNVSRQYFNDWFENAVSPMVWMHQSNHHSGYALD